MFDKYIRKINQDWKIREQSKSYLEIRELNGDYKSYDFATAESIIEEEIDLGYSIVNRITYKGFPFDPLFSFATEIEYNQKKKTITASLIPISDSCETLEKIVWPEEIDFSEIRSDFYSVLPIMQGVVMPNGWKQDVDLTKRWEFEAEHTYTRSLYMPWWGQVKVLNGYMAIFKTPFDAGIKYLHISGGASRVAPVWYSQLGKIGYRRVLEYRFYEECDYNLFCKEYRAYLQQTGELCTLQEKMIKNPNVKYLLGASIFHDEIYHNTKEESFLYDSKHPENLVTFKEMEERIQKVKEAGIDKCFVHIDGWGRCGYDREHPDVLPPNEKAGGTEGMKRLMKKTRELGYLFAIHDQYRDFYTDAPSYRKELSKVDPYGKRPDCHWWVGGEQEFLCPEFYLKFVKRNFTQMEEEGIKPDGAYLDVFACVALDECYHPLHRMTRKGCMEKRKECFDYVRSKGILVSSEEGIGWAMRDLDIVHHAAYGQMNIPDPSQMCGQILPDSIGIPTPLLNLVYHDCIVIPWFTENKKNEMPNYESGFLHALLNGGISYVSENMTEDEFDKVKKVAELHKKIGCQEMISHEFVGGNLKIQRSKFADGTEVVVDFTKNTYQISI